MTRCKNRLETPRQTGLCASIDRLVLEQPVITARECALLRIRCTEVNIVQ